MDLHVLCHDQRITQFGEGNVRVLLDQFRQEALVSREFAAPGRAALSYWIKAFSLAQLRRKADPACGRDEQSPGRSASAQTIVDQQRETAAYVR